MNAGEKLAKWAELFAGNDSLSAGFAFPMNQGETVTAPKPIRANRYVKKGEVLEYRGLSYGAVLFKNQTGKFVKIGNLELVKIFGKAGAQ